MSIIVVFIIPESVVNGDWRKVFYNGITEIEFRAIYALAFSVLKEIIIITIIIPEIIFFRLISVSFPFLLL